MIRPRLDTRASPLAFICDCSCRDSNLDGIDRNCVTIPMPEGYHPKLRPFSDLQGACRKRTRLQLVHGTGWTRSRWLKKALAKCKRVFLGKPATSSGPRDIRGQELPFAGDNDLRIRHFQPSAGRRHFDMSRSAPGTGRCELVAQLSDQMVKRAGYFGLV